MSINILEHNYNISRKFKCMDLSSIKKFKKGVGFFVGKEILDIYYHALCNSKTWDIGLGYFRLSALKLLAYPISKFIINNKGKIRVYCNEDLSEDDYKLLSNTNLILDKTDFFSDFLKMRDALEGDNDLFSKCISYLVHNNLLEIKVLIRRDDQSGIAHQKNSIFKDASDNSVVLTGSGNASKQAFLANRENCFAFCSFWNEKSSSSTIEKTIMDFEETFKSGDDEFQIYEINSTELKNKLDEIGFSKIDLNSLKVSSKKYAQKNLSQFSYEIQNEIKNEIIILKNEPHFPMFNGEICEPRDYQKEAYKKWVDNNFSGVFAMATGTGKTITSLNCLLNTYRKEQNYRAIILVPSIALLNQWDEEVQSFNFKHILKIGGGNKWERDLANYVSNYSWGIKKDLIIIITYGSFVIERFQKLFKKIQEDFLLIADEAHNMGASGIKAILPRISSKMRIGLSATPNRIYDQEGTLAIDRFFNDSPPYTYSFSMERALNEGRLTEYKYYPIIVELTDLEFKEYSEISKRLLRYFDFENGIFKDDPIVEMLLLKRKNIIHKAHNKVMTFNSILEELKKQGKHKYIFAYIPEGYSENSEGESEKILNQFLKSSHKKYPELKMNSYTSEDQDLKEILRGFSEGKIDMLFAMKMLDEGVDVPRAEIGIFASSTGNPRQFIQRRGRLLRKHYDKSHSTIYDMVVIPKLNSNLGEFYNIEKNLVKNELNRVAYFASISMNYYDTKGTLDDVCKKYELDLDTIINEL